MFAVPYLWCDMIAGISAPAISYSRQLCRDSNAEKALLDRHAVSLSYTCPAVLYAQVVAGRHCLMIDDLCDSGLTLQSVRDRLLQAGAASVKSVVLLDKKARRKVGPGCNETVYAGGQRHA
jgi:predicted amidophosphoribosyltransferase